MRKLFLYISLFLALGTASRAQNCATSYCPANITVHHVAGTVSPVTGDITYGIVPVTISGVTKCFITRNLGASSAAASATDANGSGGWYWQWNSKQGIIYAGGSTVTPSSAWITSAAAFGTVAAWTAANDPCTLLLGSGWNIPTKSEWTSLLSNLSITSIATGYTSVLKLTTSNTAWTNSGLTANLQWCGGGTVYSYWWASDGFSGSNVTPLTIGTTVSWSLSSGTPNTYSASVRCERTY